MGKNDNFFYFYHWQLPFLLPEQVIYILHLTAISFVSPAFAELQTDMTVVTSNISGPGGIPFREYRNFCMRVLFPGVPGNEHPVMRPLDVRSYCSHALLPSLSQKQSSDMKLFKSFILTCSACLLEFLSSRTCI